MLTTIDPHRALLEEVLMAKLGLRTEDVAALARQGSISGEFRQRKGNPTGPYYKLRWRHGSRQRVRYLGRDPLLVSAVRTALRTLQAPRRRARDLQRMHKQNRDDFAAQRKMLEPLLGRISAPTW